MSNKSIAVSPFTMAAALGAADSLLGEQTWQGDPNNAEQAQWLEHFRRRADIAQWMSEIHRNATTIAEDHVAWLKAEGWDAQVTQGSPNDLFLASTLNIAAKWLETGRAYKDRTGVDRVLLKKGATVSRDSFAHPIVKVATLHPDYVFVFQQLGVAPMGSFELLEMANDTKA